MHTRATKQLKLWNFRPPIRSPAYLVHQVPSSKIGVAHQPARHHCRAREVVVQAQVSFWVATKPPAYQGPTGLLQGSLQGHPQQHIPDSAPAPAPPPNWWPPPPRLGKRLRFRRPRLLQLGTCMRDQYGT